MKVLYWELEMGAAGDMLLASLLELLPERQELVTQMNGWGLPGVEITLEPAVKCGVTGLHLRVRIAGQEEESRDETGREGHGHHDHPAHSHSTLGSVEGILDKLPVSPKVRRDAKGIYALLAQAEAQVHGQPVDQIHFHEVGTLDAICDIAGVCLAMERLEADKVLASPVHVGTGMVRCAHGLLPVPAPATARLLEGIPIYSGQIRGELCTPTGAAILKYFVSEFGPMPPMVLEATGYGMGKKDFPAANCVRAHLGRAENGDESAAELSCNLDDMTAEAVGFAMEALLEAGALDVFTTAIGMKKSRPGWMLTCLCRREQAETMARLMLRHTTTLGVRRRDCVRYTLERQIRQVQTSLGPVRVKEAREGGVLRRKPEYEDVARAAREHGLGFLEARQAIDRCLEEPGMPE